MPKEDREKLKKKIFNVVKIYRELDIRKPLTMKGYLNNLADLFESQLKKQRNIDKQKRSKALICKDCKHLRSSHIPDKVYKNKGLWCAYKGCECVIEL